MANRSYENSGFIYFGPGNSLNGPSTQVNVGSIDVAALPQNVQDALLVDCIPVQMVDVEIITGNPTNAADYVVTGIIIDNGYQIISSGINNNQYNYVITQIEIDGTLVTTSKTLFTPSTTETIICTHFIRVFAKNKDTGAVTFFDIDKEGNAYTPQHILFLESESPCNHSASSSSGNNPVQVFACFNGQAAVATIDPFTLALIAGPKPLTDYGFDPTSGAIQLIP